MAFARARATRAPAYIDVRAQPGRPPVAQRRRRTIPCRMDGDVLISFEAARQRRRRESWSGAGARVTTDPGTGCARDRHAERRRVRAAASTRSRAPSTRRRSRTRCPGSFGGTIPARQFGEVAINLGEAARRGVRRPVRRVHVDLDALALVDVGELGHEGLRRAPARSKPGRCSRRAARSGWISTPTAARPGRAGRPAVPDLRRLRRQRRHDDPIEPFTITDEHGRLRDRRHPAARRQLHAAGGAAPVGDRQDWRCSFPHAGTPGGFGDGPGGRFACGWGPINAAAEPYARGRDFGNWRPGATDRASRCSSRRATRSRFDLSVTARS